MKRLHLLLFLAAALGLLGSACGAKAGTELSASSSLTTPASATSLPTGTARADSVTFRPVIIASTDPTALPTLDQLGPAAVDGSALIGASARQGISGQWIVEPQFGVAGLRAFNEIAAECYAKSAACPTGQLAVVVDGTVLSAPMILEPSFAADKIQISGGFTATDATALATVMSAAAHGS